MKRRSFLKTLLLGTVGLKFGKSVQPEKIHILTLSFDDGFKKLFFKVADIYEQHGLSACLNIIASGHLPIFQKVDEWILPELMGNFDDWVEQQVNDLLETDGGWLVLNVHGLDGEGWGPMSTTYLQTLIARLVQVGKLEILPAGEVLRRNQAS